MCCRTALHLAACEGRIEIIKYLLSVKADVLFKDRMGNNALDDAVRHGHREVQLILHSAGATVGGCVAEHFLYYSCTSASLLLFLFCVKECAVYAIKPINSSFSGPVCLGLIVC